MNFKCYFILYALVHIKTGVNEQTVCSISIRWRHVSSGLPSFTLHNELMIDTLKPAPVWIHLSLNQEQTLTWSGITQTRTNAHTLESSTLVAPLFSSCPRAYKTPQPFSGCIGWFSRLLSLGFLGLISRRVSQSVPLSLSPAWNRIVLVVVFTVNGWMRCVRKRDFLWNSSLPFLEFKTTPREMDPNELFTSVDCLWFSWSISLNISCVIHKPPGHSGTPGPKGSYSFIHYAFHCLI